MTWQTFLFIPVLCATFGFASYRLYVLLKLLKAQNGKAPSFSDVGARISQTLINVFGQKATLRDPKAGLMHATIFWGFIVITVGTLEQFVTTVHSSVNFEFVGHSIYSTFAFLHDLFTFLVVLAVLYAFYRRVIVRPVHLGKSTDAILILTFTGSLMVSILLMNAYNFLAVDVFFEASMPFSLAVAGVLETVGLSFEPDVNQGLGTFFKWVHMLIVMGFAMYIPGSKHLHILAAGPNTFLKPITPSKPMSTMDFEDENLEQYGAAKITDLSWKDALDFYACTECGRCQSVCPAWNTQKPLSPKNLIVDLRNNLFSNRDKILAKETSEVSPIIDEQVTEDVIWACTSCRACEEACPVFIGHTEKIYETRRNLVMMESKFPSEVQTVFKNMETNATPWAFSHEDRAKWAEGLSVPTLSEEPEAEYVFWVGCAGAYDTRYQGVTKSVASILKKAGVTFAILGKEEKCTGDPARRIGNEYLFQTLARENVEVLNRNNVKKVIASCPHCFNTIANEYPALGGNYEVIHHSQLISDLIKTGRIKPSKELDENITYHDSCYLGRWNEVYKDPREIVDAIPGARRTEMASSQKKGMCCGAGGGRMWMEETIGKRVNVARTEEAIETKAGVVASACPFCMTMLNDGIKSKEMQSKMRVMDVAELVDQSLS